MKTRDEFLIEKRDGRLETLRASKLARSLAIALVAESHVAPGAELRLAAEIIALLQRATGSARAESVAVASIAGAALRRAGYLRAALAYHAASERSQVRTGLRSARSPAGAPSGYAGRRTAVPPSGGPITSSSPSAPGWPECN